MESSRKLQQQPWYTARRFLVAASLLLVVALAVEGYFAICRRDNDFLVHRGFGQAFLAGDPLKAGQFHYLLSRGMINALTAWLPYRADRALHFGTAVVALALSLAWWNQLANRSRPISIPVAAAVAVFTLGLAGAYVLRDLEDCGLQLWLLFYLTAAVHALSLGHSLRCGFWLGLAAAYKVTPLIFLPYLLWKRQWSAAGWMAAFTILFNLAPALYLGWDATVRCHQGWLDFTTRCMACPDPSQNPLEPPRHLNQGLPVAIARFLQTYPPGHPLAMDHPGFVQFGNLDAQMAKRGVQGINLLLGLILAWRFRRQFLMAGQGSDLACEWAAVTLLCAILSPLCWLQHLALILPCVFLWTRAWLAGEALPRWHRIVVPLFALIVLAVHREFMPREWYELLVSYKLHALAALLAIVLVLTLPQDERNKRAEAEKGNSSAIEAFPVAA
jgi:hypothetical protein